MKSLEHHPWRPEVADEFHVVTALLHVSCNASVFTYAQNQKQGDYQNQEFAELNFFTLLWQWKHLTSPNVKVLILASNELGAGGFSGWDD